MVEFKNSAAVLPASDIDRARRFYEQTLGLTVKEENPGGVMYAAGSSQIFVYPSEFAGTNQATAATFEVDNIEETIRELQAAGVTMERYDLPGIETDELGIVDMFGDRGAWFKDPEGNILSLIQRGSGS